MTAVYGQERKNPRDLVRRSLEGASAAPFWLDGEHPAPAPPLRGATTADLLVVGGGYCGLWTALIAKERDPERRVVLIEGRRVGWAASGRNGGFVEASLTHGADNGERHFGDELDAIAVLEEQNFEDFAATIARYGIDAEFERVGSLTVATEPHHVEALRAGASADSPVLEGDDLAAYTRSPVIRAAVFTAEGEALVHPAKLAWGLRAACLSLGVVIHEDTPGLAIADRGTSVEVTTPHGSITARRVALATNGFPPLLKRLALRTVPVYDYALVTEPLTDAQLEEIGWTARFGMSDMARQFHYYRKTADNRILWGGYDVVYHRGRRIRPEYDQRPETFERLADHFFTTFPSLRDVRFTHAWGGMIDMSTKFVSFQGAAMNGKVAYSLGYTGLGVCATRFGAQVMLDLLEGATTARTSLSFPTAKPFPIPPEPIAYPAIETMRRAIARSDANGGKDGVLIRVADAFGIGFDS